MLIEVIAYTVQDALNAQSGGADRIELVSGMLEGGLTPSFGLINEVIKSVSIPVHVMIRPHSLSFSYDDYDIKTMIDDIKIAKQLGASGVVFGTVRDSMIDVKPLEKLLSYVDGLNVTFHRAFDEVSDQETTVKILMEYPQIGRILTSGKRENAFSAIQQIRNLIKLVEGSHLAILPGSGLNYVGIRDFVHQTGATELHFGQGVRGNGILSAICPNKIAEIKKELSNGACY